MTEPDVRKGMPPVKLSRQEFESRYKSRFVDPIFASLPSIGLRRAPPSLRRSDGTTMPTRRRAS